MQNTIIIIGAGLTGLTTAYLLKKNKINALLLEARPRIGGRIETIKGVNHTPMEMGATWFEPRQTNLIKLLNDLEIGYFPQFQKGKALYEASYTQPIQAFDMAQHAGTSYRVQEGTQNLIEKLASFLEDSQIKLSEKVKAISQVKV